MILEFYKSETKSLQDLLASIEQFKSKCKSIYEIAYLLILFVSYKKDLKAKTNQNNLREVFANYLIEKNQKDKFIHQDYFALALNYFVQRMNTESKLKFTIADSQMGQY